MSDGILGHGTTLKDEASAAVGNITNMTIGGISVDSLDKSTMDDTDQYRQFIAGLVDGGEVGFAVNYEETKFKAIKDKMDALAIEEWTITFPDLSTWVFDGFITTLNQSDPFDGVITADVTIKISGKPVFAEND